MSFTIINLFKMSHIGGAGGGEEIQQTLKGFWYFPGSPVVKTLPSSSGGEGLIPDQGAKSQQSCLTLCDPMDYTVHGILQAEYWSG